MSDLRATRRVPSQLRRVDRAAGKFLAAVWNDRPTNAGEGGPVATGEGGKRWKRARGAEEGEGCRGKAERGGRGRRERSDGVINDRVFNTLYGLAYKLRAVHRSSWQRINGREEQTTGMISLFSLPFGVRLSSSVSDLSADRLDSTRFRLGELLFCGSPLCPFSFLRPPPSPRSRHTGGEGARRRERTQSRARAAPRAKTSLIRR